MGWVLVTIILLIGAAFVIAKVRATKDRFPPLLDASVGTEDGQRFSVQFREQRPDTAPVEYARPSLGFAAKMVYNLGKKDEEAYAILDLMQELAEVDLRSVGSVPSAEAEEVSHAPQGKVIGVRLRYVNLVNRVVDTTLTITWHPQQFLKSFLVVTDAALHHLDPVLRQRLQRPLVRMAELHDSGEYDPFSIEGLHEAPNVGFVSANRYPGP